MSQGVGAIKDIRLGKMPEDDLLITGFLFIIGDVAVDLLPKRHTKAPLQAVHEGVNANGSGDGQVQRIDLIAMGDAHRPTQLSEHGGQTPPLIAENQRKGLLRAGGCWAENF